jgi:hypothetical protein
MTLEPDAIPTAPPNTTLSPEELAHLRNEQLGFYHSTSTAGAESDRRTVTAKSVFSAPSSSIGGDDDDGDGAGTVQVSKAPASA